MKLAITWAIALLSCFAYGSVVNVNDANEGVTSSDNADDGRVAEDMPDPRYSPENCGISQPGWICDPDGALLNAGIGGGPKAADQLNTMLWEIANTSYCPCSKGSCFVHDAVVLVAVVKKLKNPDGKLPQDLIFDFANDLQKNHWKADDTECQQEIVIALSLEDNAMTTVIGDDILKSGMMTYEAVQLVGSASMHLNPANLFVDHIKFIVDAYKYYVNHPAPTKPTTSESSRANSSTPENVTRIAASKSPAIPSSTVAAIVLAVIVFLTIVTLILVIPACRGGDKAWFKFGR